MQECNDARIVYELQKIALKNEAFAWETKRHVNLFV